jgi:murein DD-endopeptidase MepM/ murein hydrolase activator NlpD
LNQLENPDKFKIGPLHWLCSALAAAQLSVLPAFCSANQSQSENQQSSASEFHSKLSQNESKKREIREHIAQIRKKEQIAYAQLHEIKQKLDATTGELNHHKHKLQKTENNLVQTVQTLNKTQTDEECLSSNAALRLKEIYEGERLSFIEMLFSVESLQSLLDRFYYQERVAEQDKQVLEELHAKSAKLSQQKDLLGEQKNKLGELVSQFAKKALEFAKQKLTQEQTAERLRTQRTFYEQAERQLAMESQRLESQIVEMENSRRSSKNMAHGSGTLAKPLDAPVTSPFGWRRHPIFGVRKFHTGVDLAGPNHSPIRAADSGNVLYTGWYGGYGKVVIVSHGKGMATLYAHLSRTDVANGQNIHKGDIIGYEGTTGFSTGPHLHFEVRMNGKPNNPMAYLH